MKHILKNMLLLTVGISTCINLDAHFKTTPGMPIHVTEDGHIIIFPYQNGDKVPDFSFCGYRQSESPIPTVKAKVYIRPSGNDDTRLIQQAIDYVASLPVGKDGFRGAVQLMPGTFHVKGQLLIRHGGIVLRGSGYKENGTTILGEGFMKNEVVRVLGTDDARTGDTLQADKTYIPVGSTFIPMADKGKLKAGDRIRVVRPSTAAWLEELGTDRLGNQQEYNFSKWKPGQYDMTWERTVKAVTGTGIEIDIPLTLSLDPQYGGGYILPLEWKGRIENVGIENLRFESAFDANNPKDENHRWQAVTFNHIRNGWVRQMEAVHFAGSAVMLLEGSSQITVEDCKFLQPVSEIANHRRYAFHTWGQLTLFQRCYSEEGYRDFSVGRGVPGPNAFVQCHSERPYSFSGSTGGFSNGILMDKVTVSGGALEYGYRDISDQGAGWTAANSLIWQGRASQTHCVTPPTAHNWAYGMWTQPYGNGYYQLSHTFIKPESFFYAQLEARTRQKQDVETKKIYVYETSETAKPSVEYAAWMSKESLKPDMRMDRWIDSMAVLYPIVCDITKVPDLSQTGFQYPKKMKVKMPEPLAISNGWIVRGSQIMTNGTYPGKRLPGTTNWQGMGSLTHFYPGRTGYGLTEEPDSVAEQLARSGGHVLFHRTGLWYERRRNDHERNMQADAEVWAPFNEYPYSRSGQGEAQDRLSKYDLNKLNPWYFERLRQFADLADRKGLILFNDHYNQHNIIEEGAHWCDYPWRSANNINDVGFPEKTLFSGDKRVYMAEQFYDISRPIIRKYHSILIRGSVNTFRNNNGVIHSIGMEYTGPLHFTRFWLEEINACPQHQLVALTATKDVQDSILKDPEYRKLVDIIDIRQWHYRTDGTLYEPQGGRSLAPRQWARLIDPGKTSAESIYRAVREYRMNYPEKAVIYNGQKPEDNRGNLSGWAVFMAGGSLAPVPPVDEVDVYQTASTFQPIDEQTQHGRQWVLGKKGKGYLVYCHQQQAALDLNGDSSEFKVYWIDPVTGTVIRKDRKIKGGTVITLNAPTNHTVCFLQAAR